MTFSTLLASGMTVNPDFLPSNIIQEPGQNALKHLKASWRKWSIKERKIVVLGYLLHTYS